MIPLTEFGEHGHHCPDADYRCVCGLFTRYEVAWTVMLASEFLGHLDALVMFLSSVSTHNPGLIDVYAYLCEQERA